MIRADIATAALDEDLKQRLRIAAQLLAAYRLKANVRDWDGTRCGVLVANHADLYGRQACTIARRRGTPVLLINSSDPDAGQPGVVLCDASSTVSTLAQTLRGLLEAAPSDADAGGAADGERTAAQLHALPARGRPVDACALCRLSSEALAGQAVDARLGTRIVRFRPALGRIYAPTYSDLLAARDSLADAEWVLQKVTANDDAHQLQLGVSRSLEAFLLQAAFHGKERLPDFHAGRYRLKDWPDIGSAPELIGALKIAKALLRAPADARQLRSSCGVAAIDVNGALWAYHSAALLVTEGQAGATAPESSPREVGRFGGVLARIANRFGLARVS